MCADQCCAQWDTLTVEASLEAGLSLNMMDQSYNNEALVQHSDGSDSDMDMGSAGNGGHYLVESRLLSAYARLQLINRYVLYFFYSDFLANQGHCSLLKYRSDQWTHETRYTNMHTSWNLQLSALTDTYLTWKHNNLLNIV